jgi:hypothetical protein
MDQFSMGVFNGQGELAHTLVLTVKTQALKHFSLQTL